MINAKEAKELYEQSSAGANAAQKVAENPKTIDMSSKVFKIIESNLDRYVDEEAKKAATPESKNWH